MAVENKLAILMIEDEQEDVLIIERLLGERLLPDFQITATLSIEEAEKLISKNHYDLILLDLFLPDSTNIETLEFIKTISRQTPIIVLTGMRDEQLGINAVKSGAQNFLVKGQFDGTLFTRSINYAIERHSLQQELQRYARRLETSERKLLEAQNIAKIGNWEYDPKTGKMDWSRQVYEILEVTTMDSSPTLSSFLEFVYSPDRDRVRNLFVPENEDRRDSTVDFRVVVNQTRVKFLTIHVKYILSPQQDSPISFFGTLQDITQRKQIEEKLLQSEQQYRLLAENITDLITKLTPTGEFIYVSPVSLQLFGYEPVELKGTRFFDLIYESDRKQVIENHRNVTEGNPPSSVSYRVVTKSGELSWMESVSKASRQPGEMEVREVICITRDINERKNAEEELRKSEQQYKNLFQQSIDPIYITSANGNFINFNEATLRLFGYTAQELKGISVLSLYQYPEEREKLKLKIDEDGYVKGFEVKLKKKDGTLMDCIISANSWISNDGQLQGYQGIIRDITERKQHESLLKQKELAEQAVKLKQQFLAHMSHEIRTPLNAISGLAYLLEGTDPTPKQREIIQSLRSQSDHLIALINDILDFSKIEAGKIEFINVAFNLRDLITNLVKPFEYKSGEKGLSFELSYDFQIKHQLMGDPVRLKQILINLLGNAIKFTDEGKVGLEIRLLDEQEQSMTIAFYVHDTGIGIPEAEIPVIFESFTQIDQNTINQPEGTGLGLTITKELIELQGGSIAVKSRVGEGSVFSFVLKYKKGESISGATNQEADHRDFRLNIGPKKFLLVEDKKLNQLVTSEILKQWWPEVAIDFADNGQIAVEKAGNTTYDLILMDVQMPVMDGYEATRQIRAFSKQAANVPILAITAYATTGEAEKCIASGMNDYVSKPFEPEKLYRKVLSLLDIAVPTALEGKTPENQDLSASAPKVSTVASRFPVTNIPPDFTYLRSLTGGNDELQNQILQMILDETPQELDSLIKFAGEGNWNKVRAVAHKMKSSASYLGIPPLLELMKTIEQMAKEEEKTEEIPELVSISNQMFLFALSKISKKSTH